MRAAREGGLPRGREDWGRALGGQGCRHPSWVPSVVERGGTPSRPCMLVGTHAPRYACTRPPAYHRDRDPSVPTKHFRVLSTCVHHATRTFSAPWETVTAPGSPDPLCALNPEASPTSPWRPVTSPRGLEFGEPRAEDLGRRGDDGVARSSETSPGWKAADGTGVHSEVQEGPGDAGRGPSSCQVLSGSSLPR